jgi:hypothetical protein
MFTNNTNLCFIASDAYAVHVLVDIADAVEARGSFHAKEWLPILKGNGEPMQIRHD